MLKSKTRILLIKIAVVVTTFLFGFMMCVTAITNENRTAVNNYLNVKEFSIVEPESTKDLDKEYFKSKYDNLADLIAAGKDNAELIEAEGAVLLKNDNGALPLDVDGGEKKISLFGTSSVDPAYGGKGSAQTGQPLPPVTPKEGFTQAGFEVNGALIDFYSAPSSEKYKRGNTRGENAKINGAPWTDIIDAVGENGVAAYGDAAVIILSRPGGGEGMDLSMTGTDGEGGNYLALSDIEKGVLRGLASLKAAGKVKKIIVLFNAANQIETGFLFDETYDIDAALWIGSVGIAGFNAIGDIIAGKVNPSGHLSDTYWFKHSYNPVIANKGQSNYTGSENMGLPSKNGKVDNKYNSYIVYQEGVYVGYRYTETRYYEKVMSADKSDAFDYGAVVSHPFGSGLSYTSFSYDNYNVTDNGDGTYTVSLDVTNDGGVAGKDAVQIYVSKPYTDYDMERGIEKPAVELAGFVKTDLIAPQTTERYEITVDRKNFAVYDANDAKTYIVTEGEYLIAAGQNAHDAVNNVLAYRGKTEADGMDEAGDSALVKSFTLALDKTTYAKAVDGKTDITNLFDDADINKYFSSSENSVKYMTRSDFAGTTPTSAVSLRMTQKLADDMLAQDDSSAIAKDKTAYPAYGKKSGLKLFDLRADKDGNPIAYDDPLWDKLLDQLTWDETAAIVSNGLQSTVEVPSIAKPGTVEQNGPTGVTMVYGKNPLGLAARKNDPDKNKTPPYYPCVGILTSSFDTELAAKYGDMLGEDAIWTGYAGFYGIGLNTHRNPYGGRAYEYYSEDPFLAGNTAARQVEALQSHGCNAYIKHFALNDQEAQRSGISVWLNEQTFREIYLKSFEIAVTDGGAMNAMAAFNRIGATHCPASKALLTDLLRGEWGMKGLVVSDMYSIGYKAAQMPIFTAAGCDIPDGDLSSRAPFRSFKKNYGDMAWQMREAAHRILYATVRSNAMNGFSAETQIVRIVPGWRIAVTVLDCLFGVLFAASVIGAVLIILAEKNILRPHGKNKNKEI